MRVKPPNEKNATAPHHFPHHTGIFKLGDGVYLRLCYLPSQLQTAWYLVWELARREGTFFGPGQCPPVASHLRSQAPQLRPSGKSSGKHSLANCCSDVCSPGKICSDEGSPRGVTWLEAVEGRQGRTSHDSQSPPTWDGTEKALEFLWLEEEPNSWRHLLILKFYLQPSCSGLSLIF